MKLASFAHAGHSGFAEVVGDTLIPIVSGETLLEAIRGAAQARLGLNAYLDGAERGAPMPLVEAELRAPVTPAAREYWCVGLNYLDHVSEGQAIATAAVPQEVPDYPSYFTKATLAENAPFGDIPLHAGTTRRLDFEAELAVVIGTGGVNIPEAEALKHVAGYLCANDISARDLQRRHGKQWTKGKSLDGTCPTGPWLVTADEIPDPQTLDLRCRLNGEEMQSSNTRNMMFSVAQIIADLSLGMTLIPGDVILTGTPQGVGFARKPPVYLADGDVLETEIAGIGGMRNVIRAGL